MPKIKISISIEEDVLTQIDKLAAERKQNRSECIESLCSAAMLGGSPTPDGMIEVMKFTGPAAELFATLGARWSQPKSKEDYSDARTEVVIRHDAKRLKEWLKATPNRKDQR
jgi:hypothetical protein